MACRLALLGALVSLLIAGCSGDGSETRTPGPVDDTSVDALGFGPATAATRERLAAVREALPLDDPQDEADARRGFVAAEARLEIRSADGQLVWDRPSYDFLDGEAPDTVHPSLWRQARLNNLHGLFEVVPGIHQVRGYDLANLTLIDGETGWIVVDPLGSTETAAAALALARQHLGDKPVRAVILTHSHVDHFGGVLGVAPAEAFGAGPGGIRVVAPAGFMHESTSENVMAAQAMVRRASFMYGFRLPHGPRGHVGSGLGKEPARGSTTIIPPTDLVDRTPQELTLDGVRFVFQYAPESEAPAELMFHLPELRAFCGAEVVSRTMHNLYTLRGAKVRDALRWSGYIDEAIERFGADTDVVFASHHWPTWGNAESRAYLARQRDTYKYIHDQSLRLANAGYTPREIAEQLELPPSLAPHFGNRGYYGTVRHNAKAVYQAYFGWYDGNPANLDPHPPEVLAPRMVEAMGGAAAVREKAQAAFDEGDYRFASTLLNHLVFADPDDRAARELLASSYDQLGYQAESAPWRDVYLSGAYELRHGPPSGAEANPLAGAGGLLKHIPVDRFLDALAARLDGPDAADADTKINLVFTDLGESFVLDLENAVLHHRKRAPDPNADATLRITHGLFLRMLTGQAGLRAMLFSDELEVEGSRTALLGFFSRFAGGIDAGFGVIEP